MVRQAGGSLRELLLACPGLAEVPVASLRGTRHVLRQLGVSGGRLRQQGVACCSSVMQVA